jgi:hypothetical protein
MGKPGQKIVYALDFLRRVPTGLASPIEPEGTACSRGEMPLDNLPHMIVQGLACRLGIGGVQCFFVHVLGSK